MIEREHPMPVARRPRSGRRFRSDDVTGRIRHGSSEQSHAVTIGEIGIHDVEVESPAPMPLAPGERVVIELHAPSLGAPIIAEARVITVREAARQPSRYSVRFVRLPPDGVRGLLRLAAGARPGARRAS